MQKYIVHNEADSIELRLYDTIGGGIFNEGITAQSIIDQIEASNASKLNIRINSGGGSVWEGLTIYNYLKSYKGRKRVIVDGIAASIASIIAMAGDTIEMGEGTLLMIHDPLQGVIGNAEELRQAAEFLDMVGGELANIYVNRTGLAKDKVLEMMHAETFLTASEAVEMGFATKAKGVKANRKELMNIAASLDNKKLLNILNSNNNKMEDNKQSFLDALMFWKDTKTKAQEIENEIVAPVKNELEAKLKAEQEAKAAIEAQLAEAQNKAQQVEELQAKLTAMEETIKNAGKPIETPSDDHSTTEEEETVMTEKEKLENSLLNGFSDSKKAEYAAVKARAEKIAQLKNKK